ncbi:MAG: hypothetical protein SGJ27_06010 [Candidatus Melainabacteria bacterium]|nr:hypothetical protein [Candidatus Melainabacteria bacterium]
MKDRINLRLFVDSGNSGNALSLLYKALEHHAYDEYEIEIINVNQTPDAMAQHNVSKIPAIQLLRNSGEMLPFDQLHNTDGLRETFGFRRNKFSY